MADIGLKKAAPSLPTRSKADSGQNKRLADLEERVAYLEGKVARIEAES